MPVTDSFLTVCAPLPSPQMAERRARDRPTLKVKRSPAQQRTATVPAAAPTAPASTSSVAADSKSGADVKSHYSGGGRGVGSAGGGGGGGAEPCAAKKVK